MIRAIVVALALCMFIVVLALAPKSPVAGDDAMWSVPNTTYSAGPRGSLALYLLLQELGLQTERLTTPGYAHVPVDRVLWLSGAQQPSRYERNELVTFMQGGGTLVASPAVLATLTEAAGLGEASLDDVQGAKGSQWPTTFGDTNDMVAMQLDAEPTEVFAADNANSPIVATWTVGAGRMVSLGIPELLGNDAMKTGDNGIFCARLALHLGPRHIFDEVRQGFGAVGVGDLLRRLPYRALLAQLAVLLGVALLMMIPRRWPVRTTALIGRRRVADHVEAVARLWQRAGDARIALSALMTALDVSAQARLVTATVEHRDFMGWVVTRRPDLRARARAAWDKAEQICTSNTRTSPGPVRDVAAELIHLERETQLWSRKASAKQ